MYGFGFSYARRLNVEEMSSTADQQRVIEAIRRREFDAVIFGKVGPRQGCDPVPLLEDVVAAGYPPQRVALIYGGDFGLASGEISRHIRLLGNSGLVFVREIDAPVERFVWRPASVMPAACYLENEWRLFFKLWGMRLSCWGCEDMDAPVELKLWPVLEEFAGEPYTVHLAQAPVAAEECWTGFALLGFSVLARQPREVKTSRCEVLARKFQHLDRNERRQVGPCPQPILRARARAHHRHCASRRPRWRQLASDFFGEFGIRLSEVRAFACVACGHVTSSSALSRMCSGFRAAPGAARGAFGADYTSSNRASLSDLRS